MAAKETAMDNEGDNNITTTMSTTARAVHVIDNGVRVWSRPSMTSKKVANLPKGTVLDVIGETKKEGVRWFRVHSREWDGWVSEQKVKIVTHSAVVPKEGMPEDLRKLVDLRDEIQKTLRELQKETRRLAGFLEEYTTKKCTLEGRAATIAVTMADSRSREFSLGYTQKVITSLDTNIKDISDAIIKKRNEMAMLTKKYDEVARATEVLNDIGITPVKITVDDTSARVEEILATTEKSLDGAGVVANDDKHVVNLQSPLARTAAIPTDPAVNKGQGDIPKNEEDTGSKNKDTNHVEEKAIASNNKNMETTVPMSGVSPWITSQRDHPGLTESDIKYFNGVLSAQGQKYRSKEFGQYVMAREGDMIVLSVSNSSADTFEKKMSGAIIASVHNKNDSIYIVNSQLIEIK